MSDHDIELLKLQIQREQAARDFWKWAIMYVLLGVNPLVNLLTSYLNHQAIGTVGEKADAAASNAAIVEKKTDAIAVLADSSVKNWKAYNSKSEGDKNIAAKALEKAEAVAEKMP